MPSLRRYAHASRVNPRLSGRPGRFAYWRSSACACPVAFASASRPPIKAARKSEGARMSNQSRKPAKRHVIRAKDLRSWFKANLREYARDIANHGADAGFPCITYTSDAVKVFDRFAAEIWDMAVQEASELGCKNACELIAGFGRSDMIDGFDQFKNLMVWYACEQSPASSRATDFGSRSARPVLRPRESDADIAQVEVRRAQLRKILRQMRQFARDHAQQRMQFAFRAAGNLGL
jgi:hypothetical protein